MSPTALMARLFMRKREEETIEKRDEPDAHKTSRQYSSSVRRLTSLNLCLAFKTLVPALVLCSVGHALFCCARIHADTERGGSWMRDDKIRQHLQIKLQSQPHARARAQHASPILAAHSCEMHIQCK